jgi:tetratricopeptide (TPR) repeat protein
MLYAEGKFDDALKAMSAAADAEDKTEKHPVTPGVPEPARELYGAMLLERGVVAEALAAFEATIKKEPNRFNAFAGAAKAADRLGDKAKAKDYFQKLATLASGADTVRPDLAAAREFLARRPPDTTPRATSERSWCRRRTSHVSQAGSRTPPPA